MNVMTQLAGLREWYLGTDVGKTDTCIPDSKMIALAETALGNLPFSERAHISECPRCACLFASFRGAHCAETMPSVWSVTLRDIALHLQATDNGLSREVLTRINLENRRLSVVRSDDDWLGHPMYARVKSSYVPSTSVLTIRLVDLPEEIEHVTLDTPHASMQFTHRGIDVWELVLDGSGEMPETTDRSTIADFLRTAKDGVARLTFTMSRTARVSEGQRRESDVAGLLAATGAIERAHDYVLPSGLHSDTYVNIGKLCGSEESLHSIAAAFNAMFRTEAFDTIVACGWAMAMIARRLADLREHNSDAPIRAAMWEGYDSLRVLEDVAQDARVLILVDVQVTGNLISHLKERVRSFGAQVVGIGTVVDARYGQNTTPLCRSLCHLEMDIVDPHRESCTRCGRLPYRVYNPFACRMTDKAPVPRSPSQFLTNDEQARDLWNHVETARAYSSHVIKGHSHYIAFVDTMKLLTCAQTGGAVVRQLVKRLLLVDGPPSVLIVPDRERSRLFADMMIEALHEMGASDAIQVAIAIRRGEKWLLAQQFQNMVRNRYALVLDCAAGHGKTIDKLCRATYVAGADRVGAAVIISRLSGGCEEALQERLGGRFFRLYSLPIRPYVIRGADKRACPVCLYRATLLTAAQDSGLGPLQRWASWVLRRGGKRATTVTNERFQQLSIFTSDELLYKCRAAVAGGVALHALYAAMGNGMAPMALPELRDNRIPSASRTAMTEHLPVGAVEWSSGFLRRDLELFLETGSDLNVWRAAAGVLAREMSYDWIEQLGGFLQRSNKARTHTNEMFWNDLTSHTYLLAKGKHVDTGHLKECLQHLLTSFGNTTAGVGLRKMIEAVDAA